MYTQVCTIPNRAYYVSVLGRFQWNPWMDHWKASKEAMRYLQCTKDFMLVYSNSGDSSFGGSQNDICVSLRVQNGWWASFMKKS